MIVALPLLGCAPPPPPEPLDVWLWGCDWVDGRCQLPEDRSLVVWVGGAGAVALDVDGASLDVVGEPSLDGLRFVLPAPVAPGRYAWRRGRGLDAVEITREPPPSPEVVRLREAARTPACDEVLPPLLDAVTQDEASAATAICARTRGDLAGYGEGLARALVASEAAGRSSDAWRRRAALLQHTLEWIRDTGAALRLLEAEPITRDADAAWILENGTARLNQALGDVRAAETHDREAYALATRVDVEALAWRSAIAMSIAADEIGDTAGAARWMRERVDLDEGPRSCDVYQRYGVKNLAWYELTLEQYTERQARVARWAGELLDTMLQADCGDPPSRRADFTIDRARAAWLAGDLPLASRLITEVLATPALLGPSDLAWATLLSAEIHSQGGRSAEAWQEALDAARRSGSVELEIRALLGAARARPADRESLLHEAESLVLRRGRTLPFGADRGAWLETNADLTGALAAASVDRGAVEEALEQVRVARARVFGAAVAAERVGSLTGEARASWAAAVDGYRRLRDEADALRARRWEAPQDELPAVDAALAELDLRARTQLEAALGAVAPEDEPLLPTLDPSTLVLSWWPDGDTLLGFAATDGQVWATRVPRTATDEELLAPFAELVERASRIVLMPWQGLAARDLDAAPVGGVPLAARVPVVWSMDLGPSPSRTEHGPTIVVSDPLGDLPEAHAEGERIAASAGAVHLTGAAATRSAVLDALRRSDRLHVATHGDLRSEGAATRRLVLADGGLEVGDLLSLGSAPSQVFLSGCETGLATYGLGLAQGLLLAGSDTVVASQRPVQDHTARELASAWSDPGAPADPALRLATARTAVLNDDPQADVWAWRLWIR